MLDGLEAMHWRGLTHAYGPADDVPETLQALASGRASAEDTASVFWSNINHQGTVYEATAYAVPFLIELLGSEQIKDREWLLLLLEGLAGGSSRHAADGDDWAKLTHEAVALGIPLYLDLLQNTSPNVRTTAALVLSRFPEHAGITLPRLRQSLRGEPSRDAQASLLLCLGKLRDSDAATGEALDAGLRCGRDDPRRLAAALGLVLRDEEGAAPAAVRVAQEVLAHPETFPESYVFSAWEIEADPGQSLYEVLLLLGPERGVFALLGVLDESEEPSDILIDTLIAAGFPGGGDTVLAPSSLTADQRRILTALLEVGPAWDDGGEWKAGFSPEQHGLPENRRGVERLLKVEDA